MKLSIAAAAVAALTACAAAPAFAADENLSGAWSGVITLPLIPSSGAVLPDGKTLLWSADDEFTFGTLGKVKALLFDPATLTHVRQDAEVGHNMFCTGTTMLADGRVLANGGSNAAVTSIYDPKTKSYARAQDMNIPRGYSGNTILADGSVLTLGGSWSGEWADRKDGEIWTPDAGWRVLPGVATSGMTTPDETSGYAYDSHYWLIPAGNGKVLFAGPSPAMKWIDSTGGGSVSEAGLRGDDAFAINGTASMYDAGKVLKAGGSISYNGNPARAGAYVIDVSSGDAAVTKVAPMAYARTYHNAVVLPDGDVMMIGGQTYGQSFSDSNAVLAAEIWNSKTGVFRMVAAAARPRNYHSIALLLPDGRVLSGGGGLCGCSADHPDVQIYSPGYLFDANGALASRPKIVSAPDEFRFGAEAAVVTDREVVAFSLVRMSAATHSVNNDQRRLSLSFRPTGTNAYALSAPSNPGYLLPGNWMLFGLDAAGTPSVAKIVHVSPNAVASLVSPGTIVTSLGAGLLVEPNVVPLSRETIFSAVGLPAGMTIDRTTGAISGAPSVAGTFQAQLIATAGGQTVSTDFKVAVDGALAAGDGLLGEYYSSMDLTGPIAMLRREAPYFSFPETGPGGNVPGAFSARWSGEITAQRSGVTQFRVESDDGVRLWIGGKQIADDWVAHAPAVKEGQLDLVAGQKVPVFMEYYNSLFGGTLRLSWLRPGDVDFIPIPLSQLGGSSAPLSTANLARGKVATQSSVQSGGTPDRAVDGVVNGQWSAGSVTLTPTQANPWWQVDLGGRAALDYVRLWRRTDCCEARTKNLYVFVSVEDPTGRSFAELMADPAVVKRYVSADVTITNFIDVPIGAIGRFVRVQGAAASALQLAEAQAFGVFTNKPPTLTVPAAQSSPAGAAAALAVKATDPEGDAITFSASGLPDGLSINATSGRISGTPTTPGSYAVAVTAADALAATAGQFSWTVTEATPTVRSLLVKPTVVNRTVTYSPTILNGEGVTYRWSFGDGTADTAFSTSPVATHVFKAAGSFDVTLTMRTASGRQTTYGFDQAIYVKPASDARGATSGAAGYEARSGASPRLWIANPDNDSVAVLDLGTNTRVAEIPVGVSPQSLAIAPNGGVWVVNRDSSTVSVVDPASLTVVRTIALPAASRPFGIAFVNGNGAAVVTLEGLGEAAMISPAGVYGGSVPVGPSPRFIAANQAQDRVFISRFVTGPQPGEGTAVVKSVDAAGQPTGGEVRVMKLDGVVERTIVLRHSTAPDSEAGGRGVPNYVGALALSPDGKTAWAPSKQDNIARGTLRDGQNLTFQNTVRAIVSKIDLATGQEDLSARIDLDNSGVASAAVMHPTGAYLFVALQTTRQVAVVDPVGRRELFRFKVGRAPSSLTLSPDGDTLYVGNFMDRTVTVASLAYVLRYGQMKERILATIPTVAQDKLSPTVLKGKQFFYDAADLRLARDGYLSCAACHDRGEDDGRTWDFTGFGEGLRNTISLVGRAGLGNGFMHWSANFNEVQDFEGQIRSFAGGRGLMSDAAFALGTRSDPLGKAKARASADLDALAAFVQSLDAFPPSPYAKADGALTPAGVTGKAAFDRLRCGSCHAGDAMTISGNARRMKDVGTIKPSSGSRLGGPLPGIDVPTLRGVWATAPYLHDGSAATLADAVKAHTNVTASAADLSALADYLKQIGPP
ncbi:putative Ig domain-containing protein [Methylopila sp. 73B]|uniref:putative Ig domain-containing protein n=1 Tax=Methylopila sp. 73B TaxID=1120792 RepID=UPI0003715D30|nr:putative Ig domain-containing protein [Methylopila sp. 73B]